MLYILDGKKVIKEPDAGKWAVWMQSRSNQLFLDNKKGKRISTIFLGADHSLFLGDHPPMVFETMIFEGEFGNPIGYCRRCSTYEQAETMHREAVAYIQRQTFKRVK